MQKMNTLLACIDDLLTNNLSKHDFYCFTAILQSLQNTEIYSWYEDDSQENDNYLEISDLLDFIEASSDIERTRIELTVTEFCVTHKRKTAAQIIADAEAVLVDSTDYDKTVLAMACTQSFDEINNR